METAYSVVIGIGHIPAYFLIVTNRPDYSIGVGNLNPKRARVFVRFESNSSPHSVATLRVIVPNGAAEGQVTPVIRQDFGIIEVVADDFIEPWENPGWGFYWRKRPEKRAIPLRVA
jgi:hypothetical protein